MLAAQEKKKKDQNEKEDQENDDNKMVEEEEEEEKDQPSSSTTNNNKPRKLGNCVTSLPDLGQNMKLGHNNFSSHLHSENAILHNSFKIKLVEMRWWIVRW